MVFIAFLAIIFFADAVRFLTGIGEPQDLHKALLGFAVSGVLVGLYYFLSSQKRQSDAFYGWLRANRVAIRSGGASYEGRPITPETQVVQFEAVVSFVIGGTTVHSRPFFPGQRGILPMGLVLSLVTFLLGWWEWMGPWGTCRALWRNLRGGKKKNIGELLRYLTPPKPCLEIHLRPSGAWMGGERERKMRERLEGRLDRTLRRYDAGRMEEGDRSRPSGVLVFQGPDPEWMFSLIEPYLRLSPLVEGGWAVLKPMDGDAREKKVELEPEKELLKRLGLRLGVLLRYERRDPEALA